MRLFGNIIFALLFFQVGPGILLGQGSPSPAPAVPTLVIAGKTTDLKLTPEFLGKLPRQKIDVPGTEHEAAATYQGVLLRDLLSNAGVPEGEAIRGQYLAWMVLLEASDGYRALFSLAELDPAFSNNRVFLADQRDGKTLSVEEGPLRLVVPNEKRHARWIRQVTRITVGPAK